MKSENSYSENNWKSIYLCIYSFTNVFERQTKFLSFLTFLH